MHALITYVHALPCVHTNVYNIMRFTLAAINSGEAESSLQKAQRLMKTVQELSETDLPSKREFIASLHSCIGNAYLEMGEAKLALEQHLSDLEITEEL